ncbi:CoA-binding protein [Candidatus Gottesmanbacteria bacterium]|nr:CoA-binding protein [Candidatus Gottesmanbacteria bacterium]
MLNKTNFFNQIKTVAIIGLSDNPERYSYQVASYLQSHGYKIIPVNPNINKVLGNTSYPDLLSIPKEIKVDVVDIFRKPELVMPHVKEAVARADIKTIWMQEGVVNNEAKSYAEAHGLNVIMNMCLMKEHKRKT